MTPRESHKRFTSFQQKIEKSFLPQVLAVLKAQIDAFITSGITAASINDISLTALYSILNNMYYKCGYGYGWSVYKQFATAKSSSIPYETKELGDTVTPDTIADEVLQVLRLSLIQNVNEMEYSFKQAILRKIQQGYEQGWGYEKTAQALRDVASIGRARRIVRTESVKASNLSGMTGAKATGLLMDKRWISARDNRVRGNPGGKYPNAAFDHWDVNGEVVGMDRPFTGTGEPMQFPGDPKGAAADVINCRCSVGYIPKRDRNGRLIRIAPGFFSSNTANMYPV